MCGIAGIISIDKIIDEVRLRKMSNAIKHRGPDGNWEWYNENKTTAFAYRRLAINDKEAFNNVPFIWQNKYVVLYNGEIYNYKELKAFLHTLGFQFNTQSDIEVIPPLYQLYGVDMPKHLNGMFAIALWDIEKQTLFATRDRLGEKPLFYTQTQSEFAFASEMKALWAGGVEKTSNRRMMFDYLVYNIIEDARQPEKTFFQNIFRIPPAHWILYDKGQLQKGCYWNLNNTKVFEGSFDDAVQNFKKLFDDSVSNMLQTEVPLGFCLSGGIDSSAIFSQAMSHLPEGAFPETFTVQALGNSLVETPYIKALLSRYAAHNTQAWVTEDLILQKLPTILYHQEEPIADLTVLAQWALMEKINEKQIKVILDGQGPDEMLGGYAHFYDVLLKECAAQSWRQLIKANKAYYEKHGHYHPLKMRMVGEVYFPKTLQRLGALKRQIIPSSSFSFLHPAFLFENKHYDSPFPVFNEVEPFLKYRTIGYGLHKLLRYADRNSMAHGIEARYPFLNHQLVEFIFSLPLDMKIHNGWTKYILRVAMEQQLPSSIAWRVSKSGYQVPTKNWMEHPRVKEMIQESKHKMAQHGIIRKNVKPHTHDMHIFIASHFL